MPYPLDLKTRVAVIGAGSMGAGIAQLAAQAGHGVRLYDANGGAANAALERIGADLSAAVARGRISAPARDAALARIHVAATLESLDGCGIAIEAIVERLDVKQGVFRQLEAVLAEDAVLATNTSSISVTAIAHGLRHPQRVIGWHFFNPATRMKLVEVIPGIDTDPELVAAVHALSQAWGKVPVDAPNTPGFIVNRVARPIYAEALRLLAERIAPVSAIDTLMRDAGGFAMGPFELMDLIGVDVNLSVTEAVFQATAFDPRYAPHVIQQELVRAGRFGRKSGRGFYGYGSEASVAKLAMVEPSEPSGALRASPRAGLLEPLLARLQAAGVVVTRDDELADKTLALGATRIAVTDGRTAADRASTFGGAPLLLLDLARDYGTTSLIAATGNAAGVAQLPRLAALLGTCGIGLIALADVAGLVLMRIVCCLANEAADVATWSGTRPADIDTAMKLGTSYPLGPLAWADAIGLSRVAEVLLNLQRHYGDVRYRRSPALSRAHFEGGTLHA